MNGVYSATTDADRASLLSIWREAFPEDSLEDAHAFLDRFGDYGYAARVGDAVASILFLLPAVVEYEQKRVPVGYIYAGATQVAYRQKGLYRGLIQHVLMCAAQCGMKAVFLRPADDMLAESYRRMGFTVPMTCNEVTVPSSNTPSTRLDNKTYRRERLVRLRRAGMPFVDWNDATLAHILTWCDAVCVGNAVGLKDSSRAMAWEWFGDETPRGEICIRTIGTEKVVGLLYPLDQTSFAAMPPIYMGYGME